MPIDDPLFSPLDGEHRASKPWWQHPLAIVAALILVAALLAILTGKPPARDDVPEPPGDVEVEIEVRYVEEQGEPAKDPAQTDL